MNRISKFSLVIACAFLSAAGLARAGTATGVEGLYFTGVNNSGGLLADGTTDSHWTVTYASIGGVENTTYQGAAYVVAPAAGGWVANTATAQWITAPGNGGSESLPGNGTFGANAASYVYTLAFNISGTGAIGEAVGNKVSISLTLAADDQAKVYINPSLNADGSINTSSSTAVTTLLSAWTNTSAITLRNYGTSKNANFKIGTNYLVVQVDNTNSQTGASGSNAFNPSGLMFYQTGSTIATIDGKPIVPEVGAWLPVMGALGLFIWQRRRSLKPASIA